MSIQDTQKRELLDRVFTDTTLMESEIFEFEDSIDKKNYIMDLSYEIIYESSTKTKVNFNHVDKLDNFSFKTFPIAMAQIILQEIMDILEQHMNFSKRETEYIKTNKKYIQKLLQMAVDYFKLYKKEIISLVGNSYFELVDKSTSIKDTQPMVKDVIIGTTKNRSLMLREDGSAVLSKPEQIWHRVKQASRMKEQAEKKLEADVARLSKNVTNLTLNLKSIKGARRLNSASLRKYTGDVILRIFTETTESNIGDKKLLSFVPAGDLAFELQERMERRAVASRSEDEKSDCKKIAIFFENCKFNNTDSHFKLLLKEYSEELEKKERSLFKVKDQLENIEMEGLDKFDPLLKTAKECMVDNISKNKNFY